jgi:membrane-bound metal-dependent hydrolase YbcI (DUF457 family)
VAVTAVPYRTRYLGEQSTAGEHEGNMEGSTHAGTGLLLGAGASFALDVTAVHTHLAALGSIERAAGVALFGVVVAGFALLPDADHPDASFAHSAGWFSRVISHLVAVLFGGHRQGMHSAFGIALLALVTEACAVWFRSRATLAGLGVIMTLCIAAGLCAMGAAPHPSARRRRKRNAGLFTGIEALTAGALVSAVMLYVPMYRADLWWLVVLGMTLHVFEDSLTGHGVAIAWPLTRKRFGGDGRQPAPRRRASQRPEPRDDDDRRPPSQPRPRSGPSKPACPACWMGSCEECTDRGCGCPQREHPARPKRKAPVPDDEPLVVVKNAPFDTPPF